MLSARDIARMERDVVQTICDWGASAVLHNPKPVEEQPNWNSIMREFVGPVVYDDTNIPVEPMSVNSYVSKSSSMGDIADGSTMLSIPSSYNGVNTPINEYTIVEYDGDMWRIDKIKVLIGSYIVTINRIVK